MVRLKTTGIVYLIGAGPGDPGLITLKGLKCLRKADCVVYDRLANKQLLYEVKPGAEVLYVGKRVSEGISQKEINQLLIKKARAGKVVARLKGGDPMIFGRGGEEALALAEANIPYEIIPGISSAYAAATYAGIPVTRRGYASTVAFITGHEAIDKKVSDINWQKLATGASTLVFLMGIKSLPGIIERLLKYGRSPETPVAIIRWGTTPRQQTLVGTLSNIIEKAKQERVKPPATIVIGEVVRLREKLNWYERKPLFGRSILVTRAKNQAKELTEKLSELGAEVVEIPTIEIRPPDSFEPLDQAIKRLSSETKLAYHWLIFTSRNGVDFFWKRLAYLKRDVRILAQVRIAAIGPATAKAIEGKGLYLDFVPEEYRAEALIEGFRKIGVKGQRILIPRAKVAREVLPEKLREIGAQVEVVEAYQTIVKREAAPILRQVLGEGSVDIITFTSSSTVKNFINLLNGELSLLQGTKIAAIGPITAETAQKLGLKVDIVAKDYTIPGLVEAILSQEGERK
jgi:uroporphyrinogen III methyltransferase/synthase